MMRRSSVRDIVVISILTAILFVQEQVLAFLPNVQLTVFLIVLYSKTLGFKKTAIIVVLHILFDMVLGGFNILYLLPMLVGWLSIPVLLSTIFKKTDSLIVLGLIGVLCSFIYSWSFVFIEVVVMKSNFTAYLIADLPFEVILACSSFLSIIWLYQPLYILINKIYQ